MFSSTILPGTTFRGTQLRSRPSHLYIRPKSMRVAALTEPAKAVDVRDWTFQGSDKEVHVSTTDFLDSGLAQKTSKIRESFANEETLRRDPRAQQPTPNAMKKCNDCGESKVLDAFGVERRNPDGLRRICRLCASERGQQWRLSLMQRDVVVVPEKKRCCRCGETKPASDYSKGRDQLDGLSNRCRACNIAKRQVYELKLLQRDVVVVPEKKRCPQCGQTKSSSDYDATRRRVDGLSGCCSSCRRDYKLKLAQRDVVVVPEKKRCSRCGETKPASEYYKNRRSQDGLSSSCIACSLATMKEHRLKLQQRDVVVVPENKRCCRCGQTKSASDYHATRCRVDGLQTYCKSCNVVIRKDSLLKLLQRDVVMVPENKRCPKCRQTKPASEYYASCRCKDGLFPHCIACAVAKSKDYRLKLLQRDIVVVPENKRCSRCGQSKPASDYYASRRCKDGLLPRCIACAAAMSKDYRQRLLLRPMVVPENKRCRQCGQTKPASSFYEDLYRVDGLSV